MKSREAIGLHSLYNGNDYACCLVELLMDVSCELINIFGLGAALGVGQAVQTKSGTEFCHLPPPVACHLVVRSSHIHKQRSKKVQHRTAAPLLPAVCAHNHFASPMPVTDRTMSPTLG
jgi:hypothetical protein